jgi:hypothetical protein
MSPFVKIGNHRIVNLDAIAGLYRLNENEWHLQFLSISRVGPALTSLTNEEATELWVALSALAEEQATHHSENSRH